MSPVPGPVFVMRAYLSRFPPPPHTQRSAPARRGNAAAVINRTIRSVGASAVDLLADTADLWPIMPLYRWAELPGVCHAGLFVEMGDGQRTFWGGGGGWAAFFLGFLLLNSVGCWDFCGTGGITRKKNSITSRKTEIGLIVFKMTLGFMFSPVF